MELRGLLVEVHRRHVVVAAAEAVVVVVALGMRVVRGRRLVPLLAPLELVGRAHLALEQQLLVRGRGRGRGRGR